MSIPIQSERFVGDVTIHEGAGSLRVVLTLADVDAATEEPMRRLRATMEACLDIAGLLASSDGDSDS